MSSWRSNFQMYSVSTILMDFPRTPPAGLHTLVESNYHKISIRCFIAEKLMAQLLEEPTVLTIIIEIARAKKKGNSNVYPYYTVQFNLPEAYKVNSSNKM